MLTTGRELKQKLATDEPVVGLMATDHAWPFLVEICQKSGLDYLVIDSEHGDFSDELVSHICQIGRLANFPVLVRTISCEMSIVRRVIDLGPCGILVPSVESTTQLDEVEQAICMPPRGRRRPGGMGNYWLPNFHYQTWKSEFEDHFIVIPQIESQTGVENVDAIAAHPIVTALGLGPYDLSADLGCCWDPEHEDFTNALATVKSAADAVNKKVWAGCDGPALRKQGYTFLWIGTATSVLTGALTVAVENIRHPDNQTTSTQNPPPA
ncbi:HpcH/HpaI aldolase family protein [Thalassoglobus polymorphus]|uniref:5-keto-4-deoxy-D-glucarate aldolase n=1 Tax=Thalassoglobus polymorphus TaxID=2527994 RepID=A0A517QTG3_9PLAN|nr:aldolase/citrate lyase family protein [Thalassoglobus polymorphus]QDT34837.1 5-keto-4-deoxy-D-glucarate aldolase [Thalassoglobus polymorphus]